jgi:CRP/FNR family transcriptional regulator
MIDANSLKSQFPLLEPALLEQIAACAQEVTLPPQQQILREGQYIKTIPIVLDGLLKVITGSGDKDMLLYYIKPGDSCIMSFAFSLSNEPSNIAAFTETETTLLILNADDVKRWLAEFPSLNNLFLNLYNHRYRDLIDTIGGLIYEKMDSRILHYLHQRAAATGTDMLDITHREIAADLASSREVISRLLKKLEIDKKIKQTPLGIKILD